MMLFKGGLPAPIWIKFRKKLQNDDNDYVCDGQDDDDGQVRRFAMAQPLLLAGIDSKVHQLFPAIAEEEVFIVISTPIAKHIKMTSNMTMVGPVPFRNGCRHGKVISSCPQTMQSIYF